MTHVIIQIPCYNEEQTIGVTLSALPKALPGVDRLEWLIIDDGCRDRTVEVARSFGVHHVVQHGNNKGLATAYMSGLKKAIDLGADVIVNTDADNQYLADDIEKLVTPILAGKADIVIGARPIMDIDHFSPVKKALQRFGSWMVRFLSDTNVVDAPSGFRAVSREAAKKLFVYNRHTYTIETIIQGGLQNLRIVSVPIRTNGFLRPSRLVKSVFDYVTKSALTMFRIYIIYRPLRFFVVLGILIGLPGLFLFLRFLAFYLTGGNGYIQSLVVSVGLLGMCVLLVLVGVIADLISVNRRLLEDLKQQLFDLKEKR